MSTLEIQFVRAGSGQVDTLVDFVRTYYDFDGIPFDPIAVRRGLDDLVAHPALGSVWLVQRGGANVGYFVLTLGFDLEFGGRVATVTELYLREGVRGEGVGSATILFIEGLLRKLGIGAYELQVERQNADARTFYGRLGFEPHDRIPLSKRVEPRGSPTLAQPRRRLPAVTADGTSIGIYPMRPAAPEDTATLVDIAMATGLFSPAEADLLLRQTLDDLHAGQLGEAHGAYVAHESPDGRPLGWAYVASDPKGFGVWNLWWIGVAPENHGRGVGSELLGFIEKVVRDASGRLVIIETSSLPALAETRRFYARRGYRECGLVPNFYGEGDGKITFAKSVAGELFTPRGPA